MDPTKEPRKQAGNPAAFDVQAFLDSAGVARRIVRFRANAVIFSQGDPADTVLYIQKGAVQLSVISETGKQAIVATLGAGDFFGEIAALTGAARTADVVAEEATQLLEVPAAVLRVMMAQPAFSQMVLSRMSERLARTSIRDLPRLTGVDPQDAREGFCKSEQHQSRRHQEPVESELTSRFSRLFQTCQLNKTNPALATLRPIPSHRCRLSLQRRWRPFPPLPRWRCGTVHERERERDGE